MTDKKTTYKISFEVETNIEDDPEGSIQEYLWSLFIHESKLSILEHIRRTIAHVDSHDPMYSHMLRAYDSSLEVLDSTKNIVIEKKM